MTLPASGAISTAQIRAEIGGSGAVVIPSAEVRTLTGVPSGPVVLPTNFHGKTGAGGSDQTPAAVNWANFSGLTPQTNATQTISSINVPITLRAAITSVSGDGVGLAGSLLEILVGGVSIDSVVIAEGAFVEASVTTGQTVQFRGSTSTLGWLGTVTVTNRSNGNATLDTFTAEITV